jgi:hypothetical protein
MIWVAARMGGCRVLKRNALLSPELVELRLVIVSVVADDDHPALACETASRQHFEEFQKTFGVEAAALPGGMVEMDRVFDFWRRPHSATRAVLLKMDFIKCPGVYRFISH